MGERAAGGEVRAALEDRGLVVLGPRLVVLGRAREGLKQRIVAIEGTRVIPVAGVGSVAEDQAYAPVVAVRGGRGHE